jgi:glycerate 2-kinase
LRIWLAGVDAVRSERLVQKWCRTDGDLLYFGNESMPLESIRRIVVVGAGKAGAGMAEAIEATLGPKIMQAKGLVGWLNVPADCVRPLQRIHLHPARPAGVNEPTPEGVAGATEILRLVESMGPEDLCLCLISGGGSALMPAPVEGIALADKLTVTRHLSGAGANIEQLNMVRKQLSRIKGGGLLRVCRAGRLVSLIISDVLGDPLDVIASGPTVSDSSTPAAALAVLEQFSARKAGVSEAVFEYLQKKATMPTVSTSSCKSMHFVIGNNAVAVEAAEAEAKRLGYATSAVSSNRSEGPAEQIGAALAEKAVQMEAELQNQLGAGACFISGGEPVVRLVDASHRGLGGRNQQLVLAAAIRLAAECRAGNADTRHIAILSGGTDGEDGPTDAAGAVLDADVLAAAEQKGLDPADYLARNDAYHFFEGVNGLIRTGPTHTNVCDVRVVLAASKNLDL